MADTAKSCSSFFLALHLLLCAPLGAQTWELVFHSGFEADTEAVPAHDPTDLVGADRSVAPPNDWSKHLDDHPNIGNFSIQYQGGDPSERIARIVSDPVDPQNRVLHYWLKHPNVPISPTAKKSRIQANIYGNNGLFRMKQRCRLYLAGDFEILRRKPEAVNWMTLAEFWNEPGWGGDVQYPFRMSLNLRKAEGAGSDYHFGIHGQTKPQQNWKSIWSAENEDFSVPIGEWLTLEYEFVEGDKQTGRFAFAVERANGEKHAIFDIRNWTRHPDNPKPNGLTSWNPLKLYTNSASVDYVRENGGVLQAYWDDLEIFAGTEAAE